MSDRLVKRWTETAEEAFGETGRQGTEGELIAFAILESLNLNPTHHPSDRELQISGIDIYIEGLTGIDVKANLHTTKENIAVEWPKLIRSKAYFWMHVSLKEPDRFIMYRVKDMIKYIEDNNIRKVGKDQLCWVNQRVASWL